jgi:hypothetical protein
VPNGLSLCALHYAAFDGNVLEVRPDLKVEIRLDVLEEEDGRCCSMACSGSTGRTSRYAAIRRIGHARRFWRSI